MLELLVSPAQGLPGSPGVAQQPCGATWRNLVSQVARCLWKYMAAKQLSQVWELRWLQEEQTQKNYAKVHTNLVFVCGRFKHFRLHSRIATSKFF